MNRYSRINSKSKSKSKSKSSVPIDFSKHVSLPISQTPPIISKPHEEKCNKNNDKCIHVMNEELEGDGEMFGVILKRSRSVSSYKSMVEKERSSSSMKRSSSVSSSSSSSAAAASGGGGGGGYCRIHHQNDYPISDEETLNFNVLHRRHRKKEKGKILRTCMRLLGF